MIICTLGIPLNLFAQDGGVSIGKGGVDAERSAILELVSKSKGFLAPRMTSAEREAIVAPVNGLLVYDSSEDCYYCYASGKWSHIGDVQISIGTSYPVKAQEGDFSFNPETRLLYVKSSTSWEQVGSKKPELKLEGSVLSVREQDSESSSSVNLAEWLDRYIDASLVNLTAQYVKSTNGGVLVAGESIQTALGKLEKNLEDVSINGGEANTIINSNKTHIADNSQAIKDTASQIRADMNSNSAGIEATFTSLETKLEADSTLTRNLIESNTTNITINTSAIADNSQAIKDTASQIRADMNSNSAGIEATFTSLETKLEADSTLTRNLIESNTTNITINTSAIADNSQAIKDTASQIRADMNSNSAGIEAAFTSLETKLEADSTLTRNLIESNTTNITINTSAISDLENEKLAKAAIFNGDVTGTYNATVIANDAVNSAKIDDGTIVAADLNQMAATNGQVLSWNGTTSTWEATSVAARSYTQKFEEDDSVPTTHSLAKTAIVNDASNSCSVALNGETLDPTSYTFTTSTLKLLVPVYTYDKVTVTYCY
ncbi:hypothetical protein D1614_15525 [Maribellus luteus]|uniref:Uncharacterized protein n=1 Tax=Maribellus luteus TaxID=2305463 RepID=A0A399SYT2_9BACT|nr:hypothetical protein D1614_15525 [Maribellus luteus]